ncbi:head-tail connector protein [Enterobacter oligotrophicus]|uniref:head-tail connector protein n=1 Tax=Enterobacter oligotrophicus TaxID=2478464 RepID=UPI00036DA10F|nr:head-tail connector protein [Enterobacter oligotrophicus]
MILTSADAKTQLRLEQDFTEHDSMLESLIAAAQRSIERNYHCKLVETQDELESLPDGTVGYVADEDIQLAMKMMVSQWYLNPTGAGMGSPSELGVEYLLFPLMELAI